MNKVDTIFSFPGGLILINASSNDSDRKNAGTYACPVSRWSHHWHDLAPNLVNLQVNTWLLVAQIPDVPPKDPRGGTILLYCGFTHLCTRYFVIGIDRCPQFSELILPGKALEACHQSPWGQGPMAGRCGKDSDECGWSFWVWSFENGWEWDGTFEVDFW